MWEKAEIELPKELENITTSVWTVGDTGVYVGVMRPTVFAPPVLWMKVEKKLTLNSIRIARRYAQALHTLLNEPILFAECTNEVSRKWANFLGFNEFHWVDGVSLHQRSE